MYFQRNENHVLLIWNTRDAQTKDFSKLQPVQTS